MRLSRRSIVNELQRGSIQIAPPLEPDQVGASSIDLRLSSRFILIDNEVEAQKKAGADVRWRVNSAWAPFIDKFGKAVDVPVGEEFEPRPSRLVLGYVRDYIKLPPRLAGRVEGKSGPARRGLMVHLTAPTIQAGWEGQIQLEMYNVGPVPLLLTPGSYICQLILEQISLPDQYAGQFQKQKP